MRSRLRHSIDSRTSRGSLSARPLATLRPLAAGAQAVGALAIGALAIGALAIGALAIGRLAIGRARIRRLQIDELVVRKLRVVDEMSVPNAATFESNAEGNASCAR